MTLSTLAVSLIDFDHCIENRIPSCGIFQCLVGEHTAIPADMFDSTFLGIFQPITCTTNRCPVFRLDRLLDSVFRSCRDRPRLSLRRRFGATRKSMVQGRKFIGHVLVGGVEFFLAIRFL